MDLRGVQERKTLRDHFYHKCLLADVKIGERMLIKFTSLCLFNELILLVPRISKKVSWQFPV